MAFLRKEHKENYTCISNDVFRSNLSLKARGMLCTMLSLPDDWEFSENGLQDILADGQTSIRSAIKELESAGFLSRTRDRDESGRIGKCVWIVCDYPRFENPNLVNSNLGNGPQLSTKESSTNKTSTKESNKEEFPTHETSTTQAAKGRSPESDASIDSVIYYLNRKTGKNFRPKAKANRSFVSGRLADGFTVEDCKRVIETKAAQWLGDPRMSAYLRPSTLFSQSKFEAYLNEGPSVGDLAKIAF